jgi:hypothetical protein
MRVALAPEARQEFDEAERFYEQQLEGLGKRFRDEVIAGIRRIRRWPLGYPCERGDIRRLILTRFPYKLLYSIEIDHLYIIAMAHQHREPAYWIDRTGAR